MRKNSKIKTNYGLIIIIVFVLLFGAVIYLVGNPDKTYTPQTDGAINNSKQAKTFSTSNVLNFSVEIPAGFKASERLGSLVIDTPNGQISIGRNGTNFDNLKDYIENSQNNLQERITNKKEITINELEAISGNINNEKLYYIYVANWVYILSTSSESLFPVLDQIAQSFRYTP